MKKVLEACIDQILQFDSEKEFEVFVEGLERKPHQFKVVNHYTHSAQPRKCRRQALAGHA